MREYLYMYKCIFFFLLSFAILEIQFISMSTCNKNKIVLITLHKNCYVTHKQLPITLRQVYDFVSVSSLIEIKIKKRKDKLRE